MEPQHLIPASRFCVHYNLDVAFLHTLEEYGLLQVTTQNNVAFIDADAVRHVETIVHLHRDLNINLEGIDAILSLLGRLEKTEEELAALRYKLRLYEAAK